MQGQQPNKLRKEQKRKEKETKKKRCVWKKQAQASSLLVWIDINQFIELKMFDKSN